MEGLGAMRTSPAEAVGEIDRISQFVEFHKGLTEKFSGVVDAPPRPIELSPGEIESLGFSLFRLGHSGLTHARAAMRSGLVAPYDAAGRARAEAYLEQTADSAYKLFKELEPIGRSKPDVGWMVWESKPLAA